MSADPSTHTDQPNLAEITNQHVQHPGQESPAQPNTTQVAPPRDVAALRAAALKSALRKRKASSQPPDEPPSKLPQVSDPSAEREEGEILDGDEDSPPPSSSANRQHTETSTSRIPSIPSKSDRGFRSLKPTPPRVASAPPVAESSGSTLPHGLVRSTVVTISNDNGNATRPESSSATGDVSEEEEAQMLGMLRGLLHDGISPQQLIAKGASPTYVKRICEEIVAGTKKQRAGLWTQVRERATSEGASTPLAGPPSAVPSVSQSASTSRSVSPDVAVAIRLARRSSGGSESSTEALIERMSDPVEPYRPLPRIESSWSPATDQSNAAKPGPSTRPTPVTISQSALRLESSYRPQKPAPSTSSTRRGGRRRDFDNANDVTTLNYGDDDEDSVTSGKSMSSLRPTAAPFRPSAAPLAQRSPPSATLTPAPITTATSMVQTGPPAVDLAETRRRALESMRRKKATPVPGPSRSTSSPVPQPPAGPSKEVLEEAAQLERDILLGSAREVPMELDSDPEEGEISEEKPIVPPPKPVEPLSRPESRTTTRGVRRPAAEDMMDNSVRPISAPRAPPPKRRVFCPYPLRPSRLMLVLDQDSDSESDDEPSPPQIHTPIIVIPAEIDPSRLLAEKEENIRRLKEQIAARLMAKQNAVTGSGGDSSTPGDGILTPSTEARVVNAVEAVTHGSTSNVSAAVVDAAVDAVVEEQRQEEEQRQGEAIMVDDDEQDCQSSAAADDQKEHDLEVEPANMDPKNSQPPAPAGQGNNFRAYQPLLSRYPELTSAVRSGPALPFVTRHSSSSIPASAPTEALDRSLLSSIILTHRLQNDPLARLCRSEASGGSCADPTCKDVHVLRTVPSDQDLIAYIVQSQLLTQDSDGGRVSHEAIAAALASAKAEHSSHQKAKSSTSTVKFPSYMLEDDEDAARLGALVQLTAQKLKSKVRELSY